MSTRDVTIKVGSPTLELFDDFKSRHGFKEDWEVFAAGLKFFLAAEKEGAKLRFLQNDSVDISIPMNRLVD